MSTIKVINAIHPSGTTNNLTFDASGNVGIGTSTPSDKINVVTSSVNSGVTVSGSTDPQYYLSSSGGNTARFKINDTSSMVQIGSWSNITTGFYTNGSERARIDSVGRFMVGTTTASSSFITIPSTAAYDGMNVIGDATGLRGLLTFRNPNGVVGTITASSSTTTYNTSSDYRLKYDVQPMASGLATISALKPVTYKWKADDGVGEGFIAHELQEVIPLAVTGEKDAVDAEGNIKAQGVDYSKIVVHLVAAIQELKAEVEMLKGAK
jgi:hypothetical protein